MEEINENRCFWDFVPKGTMPKVFLMNGKRREDMDTAPCNDTDHDDENSSASSSVGKLSPNTSFTDDNDTEVPKYSSMFSTSSSSAFSKIEKSDNESDDNAMKSPFGSTPSFQGFPGFFPGFYPPFLSSPFLSVSTDATTTPSTSTTMSSPHFFPGLPMSSLESKRDHESPDKNMFYYVDPRIPFTNYFLNLTKLLNGSGKEYSTATTPLGKMASEETRAEDREHPISPLSTKASPRKPSAETISSPSETAKMHSENSDNEEKEPKDLTNSEKIDLPSASSRFDSKLGIPAFSDPRFMNPFGGNLLQATGHHTGPMLPLPGAGLFHPAFMHLPGTGLRRFNPEKPPPVKKYKCDVCGKAFSRSNTLVTHKRIHTGDKPFKCEICSRAFRQPGNLTRHRLTHTTVKPYVCPTCNKAFNRASNLHTHMRTHTSFKAFVCPYCGKGFHQKIDMKIHCYTHTAHTARPEATPI